MLHCAKQMWGQTQYAAETPQRAQDICVQGDIGDAIQVNRGAQPPESPSCDSVQDSKGAAAVCSGPYIRPYIQCMRIAS